MKIFAFPAPTTRFSHLQYIYPLAALIAGPGLIADPGLITVAQRLSETVELFQEYWTTCFPGNITPSLGMRKWPGW